MPRGDSGYDVVVAGGGAGGVGAAIGAAKAGARVCLVEKYGFLGGAATNSQVLAYCGFFVRDDDASQAVRGAGEQVLDELRALGLDCKPYRSPTTGNWIVLLDPELLKLSLDRVLRANGVDVLLHSRVEAAARTTEMIESVTVAGMDGAFRLDAMSFVDATGDAALSLVAGVPIRVGDGEGGLQASTMPVRIGGLSADVRIDRQRMQAAITEYNRRAGYPIERTDAGIYTRVNGTTDFWWLVIDRHLPDLSSRSFTHAEQSGREMANLLVEVVRDTVPGFENAWLAQTGPQIGIRETRHPRARREVRYQDVIEGRLDDSGIARAAWPIELHTEAGRPHYEWVGGEGYFHVPYDALRAEGLDNLYLAGRLVGADARAYGSVRVMGTAFATGDAAGVAAALTAADGSPPEASELRRRLEAQGALI